MDPQQKIALARAAREDKYEKFLRAGMVLMKKGRFGVLPKFVWCSSSSALPSSSSSVSILASSSMSPPNSPTLAPSSSSSLLVASSPTFTPLVVETTAPRVDRLCWTKSKYVASNCDIIETKGGEDPEVSLAQSMQRSLQHIEKSGLCSVVMGSEIIAVMPSRKNTRRFVVRTQEESRKFEAPTPALRDGWVAALRWMMEKSSLVSGPMSVVHVTHVNQDMDWSALSTESLEKEFVLGTMLGYGAFGQVYKGVHKASGHVLAIKTCVVDTLVLTTEEIRVEVDSMKAVKHPNIVNYFGCWGPDSNARLWMLMEFCGGGSVIDACEKHNLHLTERQVSFVCYSTLLALAYLQQQKILHRDIKGRNILICSNGDIKLTDFGVAKKVVGGPTTDEEAAGTPHWMAPELLDNSKIPRSELFKADIWSLGITAIELAEGNPPLMDLNRKKLTDAILKNPPPTLKNQEAWSPAFHDFVRWCLIKEVTKRPSAALLLKHPFIARAATMIPSELMSTVLYPAMYLPAPKKPSDAKSPGGKAKESDPPPPEPSDAKKEKDKKALEKVMQVQAKKEPDLARAWRQEVKQPNLDAFHDIVTSTLAKEEQKRQFILATRPRFIPVVTTVSPNLFSISTKIFSPVEIDDVTSAQVTRKFTHFEWLVGEMKRSHRHCCIPSLNSGFTDQAKNCQWLLEFLATSEAFKGLAAVMSFLTASIAEWKDFRAISKEAKAEQNKFEKVLETKVKLDASAPTSIVSAMTDRYVHVDTLTQKLVAKFRDLAAGQQAVSRCWLMFSSGGGVTGMPSPLSPQPPRRASPSSPIPSSSPTSPTTTTGGNIPSTPSSSRKTSLSFVQGIRRITSTGRLPSNTITSPPSGSPNGSPRVEIDPFLAFDIEEAAFSMLQPVGILKTEAPTLGVFDMHEAERTQKVFESLEQQSRIAKCMQETCKRAEQTHGAYCAMQAHKKKQTTFEKPITNAWSEMNTVLPEEAKSVDEKCRVEIVAALRAYATEAIAIEKRKTASLIQLLIDLKKLES